MIDFWYAVATEREKWMFVPKKYWKRCIVTGVGYANVFRSLVSLRRSRGNIKIVNVGFAGSNVLPVGGMFPVGESRSYHPNCSFDNDPVYTTAEPDGFGDAYKIYSPAKVPCYTSGDFVTDGRDIAVPAAFDMELYAIFAMGFEHVVAIKYITDNLSVKEYELNTGGIINV